MTELLSYLAFLGEAPAALGTLATAMLLVAVSDWRWSLLSLAVQYVLAGWLFTHILEPQVAVLKILVGLMICLVLYVTARQVGSRAPGQDSQAPASPAAEAIKPGRAARRALASCLSFRLLIGVLAGVAILYATGSGHLLMPELPVFINQAALTLIVMGLLVMGLTEEPLTAGMGLLAAMTGFELLYHSLEQATTVIGFLVGIDFLIAMIIAYLTIARHQAPGAAEQGRPT